MTFFVVGLACVTPSGHWVSRVSLHLGTRSSPGPSCEVFARVVHGCPLPQFVARSMQWAFPHRVEGLRHRALLVHVAVCFSSLNVIVWSTGAAHVLVQPCGECAVRAQCRTMCERTSQNSGARICVVALTSPWCVLLSRLCGQHSILSTVVFAFLHGVFQKKHCHVLDIVFLHVPQPFLVRLWSAPPVSRVFPMLDLEPSLSFFGRSALVPPSPASLPKGGLHSVVVGASLSALLYRRRLCSSASARQTVGQSACL